MARGRSRRPRTGGRRSCSGGGQAGRRGLPRSEPRRASPPRRGLPPVRPLPPRILSIGGRGTRRARRRWPGRTRRSRQRATRTQRVALRSSGRVGPDAPAWREPARRRRGEKGSFKERAASAFQRGRTCKGGASRRPPLPEEGHFLLLPRPHALFQGGALYSRRPCRGRRARPHGR